VWSNIFNILLVLGFTGSIANLPVTDSLLIDMWIELLAIILLVIFLLFIGKKGLITRVEWGIFLTLYFVYIGYLIQTQIL
jgi:cation:H+ antiporter